MRRADRSFFVAIWLVVLPSLFFGVLIVLVPLKLHDLGWGGIAIGALFLATAAIETALNPLLGRFADLRGLGRPVRIALIASIAVSLGFAWASAGPVIAVLVLIAGIAYGAFYTPGMALLSESAERSGIAQGLAFGMMNLGWAAGAVIGPAAGGALAQLGGDALPYLVLAGICGLTLVYSQARLRPSSS
jgi:MFS family permease